MFWHALLFMVLWMEYWIVLHVILVMIMWLTLYDPLCYVGQDTLTTKTYAPACYVGHKLYNTVWSCILCWSRFAHTTLQIPVFYVEHNTVCETLYAPARYFVHYCLGNTVRSITTCVYLCDLLSHVSIRDSNTVNSISQMVIKLTSGSPSAWYLTTRHQYYQRNSRKIA